MKKKIRKRTSRTKNIVTRSQSAGILDNQVVTKNKVFKYNNKVMCNGERKKLLNYMKKNTFIT